MSAGEEDEIEFVSDQEDDVPSLIYNKNQETCFSEYMNAVSEKSLDVSRGVIPVRSYSNENEEDDGEELLEITPERKSINDVLGKKSKPKRKHDDEDDEDEEGISCESDEESEESDDDGEDLKGFVVNDDEEKEEDEEDEDNEDDEENLEEESSDEEIKYDTENEEEENEEEGNEDEGKTCFYMDIESFKVFFGLYFEDCTEYRKALADSFKTNSKKEKARLEKIKIHENEIIESFACIREFFFPFQPERFRKYLCGSRFKGKTYKELSNQQKQRIAFHETTIEKMFSTFIKKLADIDDVKDRAIRMIKKTEPVDCEAIAEVENKPISSYQKNSEKISVRIQKWFYNQRRDFARKQNISMGDDNLEKVAEVEVDRSSKSIGKIVSDLVAQQIIDMADQIEKKQPYYRYGETMKMAIDKIMNGDVRPGSLEDSLRSHLCLRNQLLEKIFPTQSEFKKTVSEEVRHILAVVKEGDSNTCFFTGKGPAEITVVFTKSDKEFPYTDPIVENFIIIYYIDQYIKCCLYDQWKEDEIVQIITTIYNNVVEYAFE